MMLGADLRCDNVREGGGGEETEVGWRWKWWTDEGERREGEGEDVERGGETGGAGEGQQPGRLKQKKKTKEGGELK